jgi:hypothetical protein
MYLSDCYDPFPDEVRLEDLVVFVFLLRILMKDILIHDHVSNVDATGGTYPYAQLPQVRAQSPGRQLLPALKVPILSSPKKRTTPN